MTRTHTPAAICTYCGADCAHVIPTTGGWQVICDPEIGGCAATSVAADDEAAALLIWNAGLYACAGRGAAA